MRSIRISARRPFVLVAALVTAVGLTLLPGGGAVAAPSLSEAEKQLEDLGVKMDATNEQYNNANVQLTRIRSQQAGLKRQLTAAQRRLDASQAEVGKIAAAAYRDGGITLTNSLVRTGSPKDYLDQMATIDWLSLEQKATIDRAKADKAAFETTKRRLDATGATALKLQKTLKDRKAQLSKDVRKWEEIRRQAYVKKYGTSPSGTNVTYNGQASGSAEVVVKYALAQQGKPYVFGAAGPGSFDCSGLTKAAWAQVGVSLPHSSHQQYNQIRHVSRSNLQPGDLVFFYSDLHHVGVFIGNNQVVHAPTSGDVVKVASIDVMPYAGAGRP